MNFEIGDFGYWEFEPIDIYEFENNYLISKNIGHPEVFKNYYLIDENGYIIYKDSIGDEINTSIKTNIINGSEEHLIIKYESKDSFVDTDLALVTYVPLKFSNINMGVKEF